MGLRGIISRLGGALQDAINRMGVGNGLLYLLGRVLERCSRGHVRLIRYYIVAQPIVVDGVTKVRPDTTTEIRQVDASSELLQYFPRPESVIRQRFASGAHCLVALVAGQFAGYLWYRRNEYDEDEVRCKFRLLRTEASAWDFDVYVEPRYRLGRTLARLWQAANMQLSTQGVAWTYSRISAFNADSLAAHRRLGLVKCHSAIFVLLGRVQLSLLPQWPFVHLSFSDLSPPQISLGLPSVRR